MLQYCHIVLDQNRPVCWSIVVKEKPSLSSQFFGEFLSNRALQATKDVNVRFFSHGRNRVNDTSEFRDL
jgi:hypothetical protein